MAQKHNQPIVDNEFVSECKHTLQYLQRNSMFNRIIYIVEFTGIIILFFQLLAIVFLPQFLKTLYITVSINMVVSILLLIMQNYYFLTFLARLNKYYAFIVMNMMSFVPSRYTKRGYNIILTFLKRSQNYSIEQSVNSQIQQLTFTIKNATKQ